MSTEQHDHESQETAQRHKRIIICVMALFIAAPLVLAALRLLNII